VIATKDRQEYLSPRWNRWRVKRTPPPFEVIVVDNGSADETKSVVEACAGRSIPMRYLTEPPAQSRQGAHRGAQVATGRYISCSATTTFGCRRLGSARTRRRKRETTRSSTGRFSTCRRTTRDRCPPLANYSRAFLCTCNASLSREAFFRAGGFDETFDLYGWEDTELGVRLREAKCRWKFAGMRFSGTSSHPPRTRSKSKSEKRLKRRAWRAAFSPNILHAGRAWRPGPTRSISSARYFLPDAFSRSMQVFRPATHRAGCGG